MDRIVVKDCEMCGTSLGEVFVTRKYCNPCRGRREELRLEKRRVTKAPNVIPPTNVTGSSGIPNVTPETVKKLCGDCNKFAQVSVLMDAKKKLIEGSDVANFLQEKITQLNQDMLKYEKHEHEVRIYPEKKEYRIYAIYDTDSEGEE